MVGAQPARRATCLRIAHRCLTLETPPVPWRASIVGVAALRVRERERERALRVRRSPRMVGEGPPPSDFGTVVQLHQTPCRVDLPDTQGHMGSMGSSSAAGMRAEGEGEMERESLHGGALSAQARTPVAKTHTPVWGEGALPKAARGSGRGFDGCRMCPQRVQRKHGIDFGTGPRQRGGGRPKFEASEHTRPMSCTGFDYATESARTSVPVSSTMLSCSTLRSRGDALVPRCAPHRVREDLCSRRLFSHRQQHMSSVLLGSAAFCVIPNRATEVEGRRGLQYFPLRRSSRPLFRSVVEPWRPRFDLGRQCVRGREGEGEDDIFV